mgnify:CR=1 FL=1
MWQIYKYIYIYIIVQCNKEQYSTRIIQQEATIYNINNSNTVYQNKVDIEHKNEQYLPFIKQKSRFIATHNDKIKVFHPLSISISRVSFTITTLEIVHNYVSVVEERVG